MNLKQLSENLGLSQTTVSRALNGYPEVSEATRSRVQLAAEQFHYAPSPRAKGLATGQALAIGHVIPLSDNHEMVNPVFGDFIAGAGETYSRNGYEMLLSVVPDQNETAIYRGLKSRRAVDGIVVHGPRVNDSRIALLNEIGLPFVVHGRASGVSDPYSWVDVNNRRAFTRATEFLLDLGHRRIALLNGIAEMDFAKRRQLGYADALKACGIPFDPALIRSHEMTEQLGFNATRDMLQLPDPPTAIITSSLIIALGVRRAIEDAQLTMGRDVSVITHDDALSYLGNGDDVPVFTATRSSVRDAGGLVAQMLLDHVADPTLAPQNKLLEAQLMVGLSTGPAPKR